MGRTRVRRRRMGLLAVGVTIIAVAWAGPVTSALGGPARPRSVHRYVVRPGDTLWSVARKMAPDEDPRPIVDALVAANGIRADQLLPGQTLLVPGSD